MLTDGLTVSAGGGIKVRMLDDRKGPQLPDTADIGDLWELTEDVSGAVGIYEYSESGWTLRNPSESIISYDVSGTILGSPNPGDRVMMFVAPRTFYVNNSLAGAVAVALSAGQIAQDMEVSIVRNEVTIPMGIIRFAANETRGTFIPYSTGAFQILRYDALLVFAPFDVDPSFADISFTICGYIAV